MSTSNLNCHNSNNNYNDDRNTDNEAGNIDDTKAWSVHRRSQRKKKSSSKYQTSQTESRSRRMISTNAAAPDWMNQLPCRLPPSTAATPSEQQQQQQPQPHILLLVGLPGSGKTVLATTLCRILPWKYMHVNQDILQSRPACLRETQRILDMGKCPIIDRCNVSQQQRQYFTQFTTNTTFSSNINNNFVPVDCVVLQTVSVQECIQRCRQRTDHPTLPPHQVHRVIGMMQKKWEEPNVHMPIATTTTTTTNQPHELIRSVVIIRNDTELRQWITTLVDTATATNSIATTNVEEDETNTTALVDETTVNMDTLNVTDVEYNDQITSCP